MNNIELIQSEKMKYKFGGSVYLPASNYVNVDKIYNMLAERNNTAGYKYYLFWSILKEISNPSDDTKNHGLMIKVDRLCKWMIALSYYSVNECKLQLGAHTSSENQLEKTNKDIYDETIIKKNKTEDDFYIKVFDKIENANINERIDDLKKEVFIRLLSPWTSVLFKNVRNLPLEKKCIDKLEEYSKKNTTWENKLPYNFETIDNAYYLILEPDYLIYFIQNNLILQKWVKYELAMWLSKRNPMIASINEKIEYMCDGKRDKSLKYVRDFYSECYQNLNLNDIYNNVPLKKYFVNESNDKISVDHVIPWSFCGNNEFWNLVITNQTINSKKSNYLIKGNDIVDKYANYHWKVYTCLKKCNVNDCFKKNIINKDYICDEKMYELYYTSNNCSEDCFKRIIKEKYKLNYDMAVSNHFEEKDLSYLR